MKARSPIDGKWYLFMDKYLPFGASISCAHFQAFSDSITHIVKYYTQKKVTNYLDDFLFAALVKWLCDQQVRIFLKICEDIRFLVNHDKTFWGVTRLTFLGLLIDTIRQVVCIPVEKVERALVLLHRILAKKKIKIHELQKLCGFLNFLCRAVVPGRAFTRRLYAHTAGSTLKPHHHVKITGEMRADMEMWTVFLNHPSVYCWPFMDFGNQHSAVDIDFHMDSSRNFALGFDGVYENHWFWGQWDDFTQAVEPSIEYLELYTVTVGVLLWGHALANKRIYLFCDNMSVVHMINGSTSSCKNCMILIRLITLKSMCENCRIFAKHVRSEDNGPSDALSRLDFARFARLTAHKQMDRMSSKIPEELWPISKIWIKN